MQQQEASGEAILSREAQGSEGWRKLVKTASGHLGSAPRRGKHSVLILRRFTKAVQKQEHKHSSNLRGQVWGSNLRGQVWRKRAKTASGHLGSAPQEGQTFSLILRRFTGSVQKQAQKNSSNLRGQAWGSKLEGSSLDKAAETAQT